MCTARTSQVAILASCLIAIACSVQWPIVYIVTDCWDNVHKFWYSVITLTDDEILQAYYTTMNYVSLIGFNIAPILLIFALNVHIVVTIRRVVDGDISRRSSGMYPLVPQVTQDNQSWNADAMLFAVVFLLIICIGPQDT
ncbi:hypothetical protein AAVH_02301 [Aphelenchoides avenae]|nr:hypothetical protein AAVH_02301 [Aphelenchus avenae]